MSALPPPPLPEEIIFEILVRVPAKCLCRFKCVSTLWRSIIHNPRFLSAARCSSAPPRQLIFADEPLMLPPYTRGTFFFSVKKPPNSETAKYRGQIDRFDDFISQAGGLICTALSKGSLQVCNPTSGECITLPKPSPVCDRFFLGHDPVENKYKIISSWDGHILTLGENKWRRIDLGLQCLWGSVCIDGVMYMVGMTKTASFKSSLMVFDVSCECYRVISFPQDRQDFFGMPIINYHGRAALYDYVDGVNIGDNGIWIFEDVPEQVWRYKMFISYFDPIAALQDGGNHFNGVTSAGELVFTPPTPTISAEPWCLYLFHLGDATVREIVIPGLPGRVSLSNDRVYKNIMVYYLLESPQPLKEFRIDQDDTTAPRQLA